MMLSKLIINKYEKGQDIQSMEIIFHEEYTNSVKTIVKTVYSPWVTGINSPVINDEKLVVENYNSVNDFYRSDFDLDAISKKIPFHNQSQSDSFEVDKNDTILNGDGEFSQEVVDFHQHIDNLNNSTDKMKRRNKIKIDDISEILTKKATIIKINRDNKQNSIVKPFHPFHHKLEIIQKNNEKIMENILKLNKLLDYTKKKEVVTAITEKQTAYFICDKCGKTFGKDSSFQNHLRQHKNNEDNFVILNKNNLSSTLQAFLVCPFCSQVWFEDSLFIAHLTERNSCAAHNAQVDSSYIKSLIEKARKVNLFLMQCEFCEKIFATVKKLMTHQNGHRTNINYECSHCCLPFTGYKQLIDHWEKNCLWVKYASIFHFQKSLICNVCYKNFDDHDNLYAHRYENQHFIIKCSINKNSLQVSKNSVECNATEETEHHAKAIDDSKHSDVKNFYSIKERHSLEKDRGESSASSNGYVRRNDSLLYQCELCGYLSKTVPSLILHREDHSQFLCQMCGEISKNKEEFDSHVKMHSEVSGCS